MEYKRTFDYGLKASLALAVCVGGLAVTASAQELKTVVEKPAAEKPVATDKAGRDPFKKFEVVRKPAKSAPQKLEPPFIQARIDDYRRQKQAAANAHVAPPKPTTALLLSEIQVIGIFRTPRGWAAMVEAIPIKLSYVVYPGETFFDGQLVAIEEARLTFRRDIVWTDNRRERVVEVKMLRKPSPVETMTAKTPPAPAPAETEKPAAPEKQ